MSTRIALSGSAGTGKTTLGRALGEALGLPYVDEGMRERIARGLQPARLTQEQYEDLIVELWEEQQALLSTLGEGFVADRSACDFAAFWLHYGSLHDRARTESVMARILDSANDYDRVVLLPWGVVPIESDGVRSTDRWLQFRFQALVEGLHERYTPSERLLRVPADVDGVEARRAWVLDRLTR
ncbi:MAG: AAA family ATPase [Planctomycetota bacterium]